MPRYSVLSTRYDHWLQVQWKGTFTPQNRQSDEAEDNARVLLDKTDVELVGNRDQIMIKDGCALMRAPERSTVIFIDVYLFPKVKKVIVHKFGLCDAYCYFRK